MKYFYLSYLIERDVCYLVLCEKNFSKRSAFSFLEDIAAEFNKLYGRQVSTVSRPYTLIEFGNLLRFNVWRIPSIYKFNSD